MRIAPWGYSTIAWSTLILAWIGFLLWPTPAFWFCLPVLLFCYGFVWAFFRMPTPKPQGGARCLLSPASGTVSDITIVEDAAYLGGRALRIGIFLSVFDVHVNRAPCAGTVEWVEYRPGKMLDARHPSASHANEANSLGIVVDPQVAPGLKLLVRQISGLIARRIICTAGIGTRLSQGALYGMIRFGSRTELWLPADAPHTLRVAVGDKVQAGSHVLVELT